LTATEAAGAPARRERSADAVACEGNKMAVRVQWRALVGKTMKQGEIREYFSNYQLPIADSGLRS